ncbi:MAG: ribosomal protein S18-alanine N-acetyltransferase, partial [Candidatus Obscuribacterales bacterium]|nr:ribosomal protein S18-alanine N-acetyltransferase [Candidatus Obscuribacterales bacterium]
NELTNHDGTYFGAVCPESDMLIGYSGFWLINDEAHITTLAVHPAMRRKHVGERLLINNIIEARRRSANWLTLEVRVTNEAAQHLYYKYAFRRIGVRRKYYQDNGEDALVLWTDRITEPKFIEMFLGRLQEFKLSTRGMRELFSHNPEWCEEPVIADRATA